MAILFILYFLVCLGVGYLGADRKMGFWGYLFFSLAFSPVVGLLLVLASDNKREVMKDKQLEEIQSSSEKVEKLIGAQSQFYSEKIEKLIESNYELREEVNKLIGVNTRLQEELDTARSAAGAKAEKVESPIESK